MLLYLVYRAFGSPHYPPTVNFNQLYLYIPSFFLCPSDSGSEWGPLEQLCSMQHRWRIAVCEGIALWSIMWRCSSKFPKGHHSLCQMCRSLVFPALQRGGKPTPLVVWLMAFFFCIWNGLMQVFPLYMTSTPKFEVSISRLGCLLGRAVAQCCAIPHNIPGKSI